MNEYIQNNFMRSISLASRASTTSVLHLPIYAVLEAHICRPYREGCINPGVNLDFSNCVAWIATNAMNFRDRITGSIIADMSECDSKTFIKCVKSWHCSRNTVKSSGKSSANANLGGEGVRFAGTLISKSARKLCKGCRSSIDA